MKRNKRGRLAACMLLILVAVLSASLLAEGGVHRSWHVGRTYVYEIDGPFVWSLGIPGGFGPISVDINGFNGFADVMSTMLGQTVNGEAMLYLYETFAQSLGSFSLFHLVDTSYVQMIAEVGALGSFGELFQQLGIDTSNIMGLSWTGDSGLLVQTITFEELVDAGIGTLVLMDAESGTIVINTNEPYLDIETPDGAVRVLLGKAFPGASQDCIETAIEDYGSCRLLLALIKAYDNPENRFDERVFWIFVLGPDVRTTILRNTQGEDVLLLCMLEPSPLGTPGECLRTYSPGTNGNSPMIEWMYTKDQPITITYAYLHGKQEDLARFDAYIRGDETIDIWLLDVKQDLLLSDTLTYDEDKGCYTYNLTQSGAWWVKPGTTENFPNPSLGLIYLSGWNSMTTKRALITMAVSVGHNNRFAVIGELRLAMTR